MNLGDEILTGLIAKTMYTVDIVTSLKNYVLKLYHNFNNQMNITEINLSLSLLWSNLLLYWTQCTCFVDGYCA